MLCANSATFQIQIEMIANFGSTKSPLFLPFHFSNKHSNWTPKYEEETLKSTKSQKPQQLRRTATILRIRIHSYLELMNYEKQQTNQRIREMGNNQPPMFHLLLIHAQLHHMQIAIATKGIAFHRSCGLIRVKYPPAIYTALSLITGAPKL